MPPSITLNDEGLIFDPVNLIQMKFADHSPGITGNLQLLGTGIRSKLELSKSGAELDIKGDIGHKLFGLSDDEEDTIVHAGVKGKIPFIPGTVAVPKLTEVELINTLRVLKIDQLKALERIFGVSKGPSILSKFELLTIKDTSLIKTELEFPKKFVLQIAGLELLDIPDGALDIFGQDLENALIELITSLFGQ